ncbi:MAG: peptidyl-prolyl cis-trans isomerase [Deltaproteobacteria bacterium]|nr:peptidyl-prolyl cis-trans isomerase [Deltaproteobacteria bacterium]
MRRILLLAVVSILSAIAVAAGCGDDGESGPSTDTTAPPDTEARHGLSSEQAAEVLVKIGDETITVGEFADRLAEQSPYLRARYNSPERRREFLDNMVRFELLAAEAATEGYDDHPEVVRSIKQVMIQQMMREEFEDEVEISDITDEEIRQYYEAHSDEFQKPQQVRASHILVKNSAAAERVLASVLARPADVNFFRETAETSNEDAVTRDRFGDLRFFSRPGEGTAEEASEPIADTVREAAFSIEQIGGVHPTLVESPAGYHIIKLTGRRAALNRTLDEARRPIQNRLWRERREARVQAFIAGLRENAEVEEHLDLLGEVRIAVPEGGSPAAEAQPTTPSMPVPSGAGR